MLYIKERFRVISTVLILMAALAFLVWQNQASQNLNSSYNNEPVATSTAPPVQQIDERSATKNFQGKKQQQQKRELEIADHKSQIWMARFAFGGILLGILGSYLLLRTLLYTRDAVNFAADALTEARLATKAAQESVNVTRDIGQKQVKSYLSIDTVEWATTGRNIFAKLGVKNVGQSPCLVGRIKAKISCAIRASHSHIPSREYESDFADCNFSSIESGGSKECFLSWENFDTDWLALVTNHEARLNLVIWMQAKDIFDNLETQCLITTRVKIKSILDGEISNVKRGEELQIGENFRGNALNHNKSPFPNG